MGSACLSAWVSKVPVVLPLGAMVLVALPQYALVLSSSGSPPSCGPGSTRRRCVGSCRKSGTGKTRRSRSDIFVGCCPVAWTSGVMPGHLARDEKRACPPPMDTVRKRDHGSSRTGRHSSSFQQPQRYGRRGRLSTPQSSLGVAVAWSLTARSYSLQPSPSNIWAACTMVLACASMLATLLGLRAATAATYRL